MEPLSAVQQAMLAAAQKVDPSVTEDHIRQLSPQQVNQWMQKHMMAGDQAASSGPSVGQQAMAGLGDFGHFVKGIGQIAMAGGRPAAPPGDAAVDVLHGATTMGKNAFQTMAEPFLGGLPGSGVSQTSPEDYSRGLAQTYGGVLGTLAPGAGKLALPLIAGSGAAMNPDQPIRGAVAAGVPAVVGMGGAASVERLAKTGFLNPAQRAANEMNKTYLPASAENPSATLTRFAPAGQTTANPMLAEANPVLSHALTDAIKRNPALYGRFTPEAQARAAGTVPDLATGIQQARDAWAKPLYDAMREQYPAIDIGKSGLTIADGLKMPPGSPEYAAAMKAINTTKGGYAKVNLNEPLTGFGGEAINDILNRPVVQKALQRAQEEEGLGLAPEEGKPYSFQNVRDAIKFLGDKANGMFNSKTGNKTAGLALRQAADALDEALQQQVPEYKTVQQEFARRSQLANQAKAEGGSLTMPKPPTHVPQKMPMSPFMSARYLAAKPLIGSLFKGIDQRTATALADYLSARGTDIPTVLNAIAKAGPRGPRPTAPMPPLTYPQSVPTPPDVLSPTWDPKWTYRGSAREKLQP